MFNLGGLLRNLNGSQSPAGGFMQRTGLNDPQVAMPVAAALMGGQNNRQSLGNAAMVAGTARKQSQQRNQTLAYLQKNRPDLAAQVAAGLPIGEAWKLVNAQPKARRIVKGADDFNYYEDSGERVLPGIEARNKGFSVELADGTVIKQGSFGKPEDKNQANTISDAQSLAAAGSDLKQTAQILRQANANTGYSGVGGGAIGTGLDLAEQVGVPIAGSARSRAIMRSGGLDVALTKVEKTKGAISNAEMALFMAAAPGMQTTAEGNAALLDMIDAVADRQIMRAAEMEKWANQTGSLRGFEAAWAQYVNDNPIVLSDGKGGVRLNSGGTPETPDLSNLSDEELEAIANGG